MNNSNPEYWIQLQLQVDTQVQPSINGCTVLYLHHRPIAPNCTVHVFHPSSPFYINIPDGPRACRIHCPAAEQSHTVQHTLQPQCAVGYTQTLGLHLGPKSSAGAPHSASVIGADGRLSWLAWLAHRHVGLPAALGSGFRGPCVIVNRASVGGGEDGGRGDEVHEGNSGLVVIN